MSPPRERSRPLPEAGPATNTIDTTSLTADSPVEQLLGRLERVRRSGRGFVARCPAHPDKFPSLSISEGAGGRALVCCHAGCNVEQIVGAVGLGLTDLFPRRDDWRPAPRRKPKPVPRDTLRALAWRKTFALEWQVAGMLAVEPAPLARRDLLAAWDWLDEHGCDSSFIWRLTCLLRGTATFIYGTTGEAGDIARSVRRLLREVEADGAAVA